MIRHASHSWTDTTFNISLVGDDSARRKEFRSGSAQSYSVRLANIGAMDSDEVVLAFMIPPRRTGIPTPKKQLLDFERVHVAKGASVDVSFEIDAEQLELVSADGVRAPHAGRYTLLFTNGVDANASVVVTVE